MNHSIPAAITMLGLMLCAVPPSGAEAGDVALPSPPLLSPDEDRVFVGGLPPGESRKWKERVFGDRDGNKPALCVENLTLQPIFPAAAPARGEGVLCLADVDADVEEGRSTATVYLSGQLIGSSRQLVVHPDCRIFVEPVPGMDHDSDSLYQNVLTCPSGDTLPAVLGQFRTIRSEDGTSVEFSEPGIYLMLAPLSPGPGACSEGCDPVECDPCCASCPD